MDRRRIRRRPAGDDGAIVGEHDPALGEATMRATWLEHLAGCELTVLGNAGHYAMFETPVALIGAMERTLTPKG